MPLRKPTKDDKLTILYYLFIRQMGGLADCLRHIQDEGHTKEELNGWVAYMQSELADTSMLIRRTCNVLGLDYDATVVMGIVRDEEKRKEYLKRHPSGYWV